ncbi:MAG: GNAT family N-acetyltransferase [Ferruginibacter sp.]
MEITWQYHSFRELTNQELYAILQLRNEVFVVEQNCVYQDADNKDELSFHLLGISGHTIVAYCRIVPPGISYNDASIGRVLTSPNYRKHGYGSELMKVAMGKALEQFNCASITISAQLYLQRFYEGLGFVRMSDSYLEDNIPHIEMKYTV